MGKGIVLGIDKNNKFYQMVEDEKVLLSKEDLSLLKAYSNRISTERRDLEDTANGSYYYVSPFGRYIGYYRPVNAYVKSQIFHDSKLYTNINARRINRPDLTLENLTRTEYNNANTDKGLPTFLNKVRIFTKNTSDYTYYDKFEEKEVRVNSLPISTTSILPALQDYISLPSSLHNMDAGIDFGTGAIANGQYGEICSLAIDWNTLPEGSYWRYTINDITGMSMHTMAGMTMRLLLFHTDKLTPQGENVIGTNYADQIETIEFIREGDKVRIKAQGKDKWYSNAEYKDCLHKIERPKERYTYLFLEIRHTGHSSNGNSQNGLLFNLFVPEDKVLQMERDDNSHTKYIYDYTANIGKLWNSGSISFKDYSYFPVFPLQGDTMTTYKNLTSKKTSEGGGTPVEKKEYMYLGPYNDAGKDNPQRGQYYIIHGARHLASNSTNKIAIQYLLGEKEDRFLTFWKEIK